MSASRERILGRLRQALADPQLSYPPAEAPPLPLKGRTPITAMDSGDSGEARRFQKELAELHGDCDVASSPVEARMLAVRKVQEWHSEDLDLPGSDPERQEVMVWPDLDRRLPGLTDALQDRGFTLRSPRDMSQDDDRTAMAAIRIGVTSVQAAFAATGSLLMRAEPGRSRVASLLPYHHLALVPEEALWPNVEAWMAGQHEQGNLEHFVRGSANLTLISGPSKSADIESKLTLGVHGPRHLHVVIVPA